MAADEHEPDKTNDPQNPIEPAGDAASGGPVDYELTAKDAGWRSPTLFVSRAKVVVFDPPRPRRPRES